VCSADEEGKRRGGGEEEKGIAASSINIKYIIKN
jgi:hypothetical protein